MMKQRFNIFRTSNWDRKCPCDEAIKEKFTRVDQRCTDHPHKIPINHKMSKEEAEKWWLSEGTNHRLEDNKITRDMETDEDWFIYLTFEELKEFIKKYKECVIGPKPWHIKEDCMYLEIYDSYRE